MQHHEHSAQRPGADAGQVAERIAAAAVIADVECNCPCVTSQGVRWYDTRPMLDPREHSGELVDMATEAIQYGLQRGLLVSHPEHAHLVRVAQRPA
jgi:hypothetical protein